MMVRIGLGQQLVTMLPRSDTPRLSNADQMAAHLGKLVQQAYDDVLPHPPPGNKHCHEFLFAGEQIERDVRL